MSGGRAGSRARVLLLAVAAALAAGCEGAGVQSMMHPRGAGAREVLALWWVMFGVGGAAYLLVLGLLGWAIFHRHRDEALPRPASRLLWIGVGGIVLPAAVITIFFVLTMMAMAEQQREEQAVADVTIEVAGRQWWWDIVYHDPIPARRLRTANEIHVPVGRRVAIVLESRDVIHSFWVPNLHGKTDMIPGRRNRIVVEATEPGVYRGQCAEFCGLQHANMAFTVVALPADEFDAWYEQQLVPPPAPVDALAVEGQRVFLSRDCALCHTVRGTDALAAAGPDLTFLARRRTLAAGTLPNTRGHLGGWITNAQALKPGSHMPDIALDAAELRSLLAYLETLR